MSQLGNDPLYHLHVHQARKAGKSPLSYEQFCARLQETREQELNPVFSSPPSKSDTQHSPKPPRIFSLGKLCATPGALSLIPSEELAVAFARHARCDWGDLEAFDIVQNERALRQKGRLLSRYVTKDGHPFWIITEADRSVTTALLPEEY